MAAPFFIWKDIDSRTKGIWVSQYPAKIRPQERVSHLTIAGRAGQLTMTEGNAVFEPITLQMRIQLLKTVNLSNLSEWLSGESLLVLGREPTRAYMARLVSEIDFGKYSNDIVEATLEFEAEPFTQLYPEDDPISVDVEQTDCRIVKQGNATAYPVLYLVGSGEVSITVGLATLTISDISGDAIIDCGALMVTNAMGENILDGTTGDFFEFGGSEGSVIHIEWQGDITSFTITPNWRWY